jgi:putative transposase
VLQLKTPSLTWADRTVLAALALLLPSCHLRQLCLIISPRTLLRWRAELVRRRWAYPRCTPGRPRPAQAMRALVLEMAPGQPGPGLPAYPRRADRPGHKLAPSTVWKIPKDAGINPAPERAGQT